MAVKASAHITLSIERDIEAYYRYYLLQSSTLAKPSKPTTKPPSSSWDDTEPTYTAGSTNSLYFVDLTVFTDGTWSYSDVSLSSSYEAAKEAYNKAVAAGNTANDAKDAVDNMEIGGRNLARDTSSEWGNWWTPNADEKNDTEIFHYIYPGDKEIGDVFTVSFDIEVSQFAASSSGTFKLYIQGSVDDAWTINNPFASSGKYNATSKALAGSYTEHVSYMCEIADSGAASATKFIFGMRCDYSDGTGKLRIKCLKVEKGNKATDWTPAPEDVEEDIESAQTAADQAQNTADEATTRVNTAELTIDAINACIASLVVGNNGESLMTQTEDGWQFNIGNVQDTLDTTSSNLNTLTNTVGSVEGTVNSLRQAVNDLGVLAEYVRITTYYNEETGNNEPCIELGESDSDFKVLITNTRILFMEGSNTPTYIKDNTLMTNNVEVKNELRQTYMNSSGTEVGHWTWSVRQNGNYGLVWKEV